MPRGHTLGVRRRVKLEQLTGESLILYERGSTGRQHVLDAFYERGLVAHAWRSRPRAPRRL